MATYHEQMYLSDVLLHEVSRGWTTQNVKVKTDVALAVGTALFRKNTGEDFLVATPTDLSQVTIAGILAENVEPSDAVQNKLAIMRGAVVATENLIFPSTAEESQIKMFLSILNGIGIITQGETLPTKQVLVAPPEDSSGSDGE